MDNTLTNERTHTSSKTRILAQIGMLGAISVVLMLFEIPLPFAPAFYEPSRSAAQPRHTSFECCGSHPP